MMCCLRGARKYFENLQSVVHAPAARNYVSENNFLTVVMNPFVEVEAASPARRSNGPASKASRYFDNVLLRVAAVDAKRVKLHQLARVVFIQSAFHTLLIRERPSISLLEIGRNRFGIVEIKQHRRTFRSRQQQIMKLAQGVRANRFAL